MLRRIHLDNFVNFFEPQEVEFSPGINIFVGENASGKTCMLEAVRRTLPLYRNLTFSKIPDKSRHSYIVCKYSIQAIPELSEHGQNTLYSVFIGMPDMRMFFKGVALAKINENYNETNVEKAEVYFSKVVEEDKDREKQAKDVETSDEEEMKAVKPIYAGEYELSSEEQKSALSKLIELDCGNSDSKATNIKAICDYFHPSKLRPYVHVHQGEEKLKHVDDYVAVVLPLRGLSPAEWSHSPMLNEDVPGANIARHEKDEIIKYFLHNKGSYNEEKEKEIFQQLTNNCNIVFFIDDKNHLCARENGTRIPILKVPEGFVMAKEMSFLLSSNFLTIGFEEPVRGMHTQMVLTLRDVVLFGVQNEMEGSQGDQRGKQKVIFMTSHNPVLLSTWTLPKTFIFQKREFERRKSNVCSANELFKDETLKSIRILTTSFPSLLFSRHVLFVEGQTDLIFIDGLKDKILRKDKEVSRIIKIIKQEENVEDHLSTLIKYLTQLNVQKMDGGTHRDRLHRICKKLGLNYYFILDKDIASEETTCKKKAQNTMGRTGQISGESDLQRKENTPQPHQDEEEKCDKRDLILERQDLLCNHDFIWSSGDLENMAVDTLKRDKLAYERCVVEKLISQATKSKKSRHKFLNKENITREDISLVMQVLLANCKEGGDDIVRLIEFLLDNAGRDLHEMAAK